MNKDTALLRGLILAGICLPLALFLGYQLATPEQRFSLACIGAVLGILLIPIFLRWHHPLLIVAWNLQFLVFFLPGRPEVIYVVAGASLLISLASRTLRKEKSYIPCPAVAYPLIALAVLTLFTMEVRGGLSGKALGSSAWGASRYLGVLGSIIGYFALVAQPIPPRRAKLFAALFFLSGITAAWPDLLSLVGGPLRRLQLVLPSSIGAGPAHGSVLAPLERFGGFSFTAYFYGYFMIMRYGLRGLLDWHRPWRLASFAVVFGLGLLGGFRSQIVLFAILFLFQIHFERLYRSALIWVLLGVVVLFSAVLLPFAEDLPLPVQRAISFLPVKINPVARAAATQSLDMRLEMWQRVLPEVPEYLLLGKGYNFSSTELYMTLYVMHTHRFRFMAYDDALVTGDYHQGILTLIIPLGIGGLVAFLFFCWGALRALYANYRYGDESLHRINTFLLALFATQVVWYIVFYGEFYLDLAKFTGIIGFSLSLNGGVKKPATAPAFVAAPQRAGTPQLQPA